MIARTASTTVHQSDDASRIIWFWRAKLDTYEIAQRMNMPEHEVCRVISAWREERRTR